MNAQQDAGTLIDCRGIIADPRAVSGPHLAQDRAALRADIGNAKRAANLDQLAAGDHHFSALGERVQSQKHSTRVVVDH